MSEIYKCSPVEMRKNLMAVDAFKKVGMDFVPIPVLSTDHKAELLRQLEETLLKMEFEE